MKLIQKIFICLLFGFLSACGGGSTYTASPTPIIITITLSTATPSIQVNQTAQINATVTGTTDVRVTYTVDGGAVNGSVDANGLFHAPAQAGTFVVRATSAADVKISNTVAIVVALPPANELTITPTNPNLSLGGNVAFSTNMPATFVVTGGNANGSVISTGLSNAIYTAPNLAGVYQVVATSVENATKKVTATVTVNAGNGFRINASGRIAPNTTTQFVAYFNNQAIQAVWTIEGNCGTCSIGADGLFTAGAINASVLVRGTLASDSTQTATLLLTVATEVILTVNGPISPSLTAADMLTFNANISPDGINRNVNWAAGPSNNAGSVISVDYFKGYLPPATPGTYTLTATSVADPSKSASFTVQVTAAPTLKLNPSNGNPSSMRYGHTTAALPDGKMLMVGGHPDRQTSISILQTDLFNPLSGTFSQGPALTQQRIYPEAIALDNERVLVTGGEKDYQTSLNTAEVLNLTTGLSTAASNTMSALRIHHRMNKMTTGPNNGKILIMGGFNGPVPYGVPSWLATNSVDFFNPANNTFSPSSSTMKIARGFFTATTMLDGRILIVGGYQPDPGSGALASAEIYDPVTDTFTFTGAMTVARYGHTASRLPDGKILIVGGERDTTNNASAEIYNPATGTFTSVVSKLATTRIHHAAASLADGRVLIFGGESGEFIVRGTVEVFDPTSLTFSLFAAMSTARTHATATSITAGPQNGKVLTFGGGAVNLPEKTAEISP